MTSDEIKEQLKQVKYPGFSRDIVSFGLVRSAGFFDGTVKVSLALASNDPTTPLQLKGDIERVLRGQPGVKDILVEIAVTPPLRSSPSPALRRMRSESKNCSSSEGSHCSRFLFAAVER